MGIKGFVKILKYRNHGEDKSDKGVPTTSHGDKRFKKCFVCITWRKDLDIFKVPISKGLVKLRTCCCTDCFEVGGPPQVPCDNGIFEDFSISVLLRESPVELIGEI